MTEPPPLGPLGDLPDAELRGHLHRIADWVADYRTNIADRAIVPDVRPGDVTAQTPDTMPERGEPLDAILIDLDSVVLPGVVHWGHPAFLGYFGSTSNGPALLGEIAAAALNVSAMTWTTSPAATELEAVVLRWIQDIIGIDRGFMGVVYDTASVGVLHALAAARERAGEGVRARGLSGRNDLPVFRVYASDQAHSSLEKAMIVLGLGEANVVRVPTDENFAMDVGALESAIRRDEQRGMRAMAVVATVGTTSTASVDPLKEIAAVSRAHGAWLHVDAAYGGAMAVLPEGRAVMAGAELADSIVVNPHKWLFVPLDFSALYVRDPSALRAVFALTPEYLEGDAAAATGSSVVNYMDYGLQLGRRFRALKAWMVFRAFGREGIASRIREHHRLAMEFAHWVTGATDFVLAAPLSMGIVCFRFEPPGVDPAPADRLNTEIVERVNASGRAYLTHTRLRGRVCMRVGIGNIATTEAHLRAAWELVQEQSLRVHSEPHVQAQR
jgi:aromatic-L-amino-acid decarboxylase